MYQKYFQFEIMLFFLDLEEHHMETVQQTIETATEKGKF